jgi:AraC-like DNA-binding protein
LKPVATQNTDSQFWRDQALPFLEVRTVKDGRQVSHAKHTHETFSIGAITAGQSTYLNGSRCSHIRRGSVVIINPETVHACNPIKGERWAYQMLYIDTLWLGQLQRELGYSASGDFVPFGAIHTRNPAIHLALIKLHDVVVSAKTDMLAKHSTAIEFFMLLQRTLDQKSHQTCSSPKPHASLQRAADYIHEYCLEPLTLDTLSAVADLSASYLIRAFKEQYGMTPHAYLINRRIQLSRQWLRQGQPPAEVAIAAGFADQAHFHRAFKRHLSATPGHYRRSQTGLP